MTAEWKSALEEALRTGMKYCFKPNVDGQYPEMDEVEFSGGETTSGYIDFVTELVRQVRKSAFTVGYTAGAADTFLDLSKELPLIANIPFDSEVSKIGAERRWNEQEGVDCER